MIRQMLEAGVHFGHRVQRWNPRMAPYIYGQKNGIHIIDILKTVKCLQEACLCMQNAGTQGKSILFVGTKRPAANLIELSAAECEAHYITQRWLGGFLTNWSTMRQCIKRLNDFDTSFDQTTFSKKEQLMVMKQRARLEKLFGGVKHMNDRPDMLVIVGQNEELNAVKEAQLLKLPTITFIDTDCNPDLTTYCIPANDDSVPSIQFILSKLVQSFVDGKQYTRS
jgi:small subunit ribosomal protein S2